MLDAAIFQERYGYDFNIVNGDIEAINNFKTAIYVSLFSDARADSTQVFYPQYRRGWIGDLTSPLDGRNYGSLLWLLQQERLTQSTLNKAISYARQSLQWIVDQGQASAVDVSGSIVPTAGITLSIIITTITGQTESHYVSLWENTINAD